MSVTIARAVVAGLRAHGITVHESDGAYSRGNGQTSAYMGLIVHHTASGFGRDYPTLYNGRSDLPGPLCNTSGNDDGSITLVAAHPANHAGASGGWDTAPLPRTSLFNKLVWGHEIVYPGTVPMRDAQYRSATVLGRVVCDVLGRSEDYIKMHQGTSVTGKYDAGFAPGKTYDIQKFRRDAAAITMPPTAPTFQGSDEAMIILGNDDQWPPQGTGPFECSRLAYNSGGIFTEMDPAGNKVLIEDAVNNRKVPAVWFNNTNWNDAQAQAQQIRAGTQE